MRNAPWLGAEFKGMGYFFLHTEPGSMNERDQINQISATRRKMDLASESV